jgi:hypothetical protein
MAGLKLLLSAKSATIFSGSCFKASSEVHVKTVSIPYKQR